MEAPPVAGLLASSMRTRGPKGGLETPFCAHRFGSCGNGFLLPPGPLFNVAQDTGPHGLREQSRAAVAPRFIQH